MSGRGGGRGGFRGGRGGGGGGGRPEAPMGMMTFQDVQATVVKEGGALYPDRPIPTLSDATKSEALAVAHTLHLAQVMRDSPYRLIEKKKTAELESYSDKYRQSSALAASSLNAEQLGLDKSFFPERVWAAYFERKVVDAKRVKKRKRVEDGDDEGGADDDSQLGSSGGSDAGGDEDAAVSDFDEVEDEDDDYGQQYFDNGEGDGDDGDMGGGGDEGDMY